MCCSVLGLCWVCLEVCWMCVECVVVCWVCVAVCWVCAGSVSRCAGSVLDVSRCAGSVLRCAGSLFWWLVAFSLWSVASRRGLSSCVCRFSCPAACGLSSPTEDRTHVPCIGRPILNPGTSREMPRRRLLSLSSLPKLVMRKFSRNFKYIHVEIKLSFVSHVK